MRDFLRWAIWGICLNLAVSAFADGMFFDKVGTEVAPKLPYQRALVSYRNGRETLIVESMLNAPAGDYAWVVPLPASPIKMAPSTPGVLETAVLLTPPQNLVEGTGSTVPRSAIIAIGMIGVAIWGLFRHKERSLKTSGKLILECVAIGVLLWWLGLIFAGQRFDESTTTGAKNGGGASANVQVLQQQTLGAYDAVVIKGRDAKGILQWLSNNGYRVPDAAKPIVEGYVRDGWCFLAAKLRNIDGGTASPHPLKVSFDTPRAVYPMRLTALAGTPLLLDLFIVGESYGRVHGLDAWASNTQNGSLVALEDTGSLYPYNHPGLAATMWNDACVTRYRGRLRPSDMRTDLWVSWNPTKPSLSPVYEPKAAASRTVWGVIWGFTIAFALGAAGALSRPGRLSYRIVATVVVAVALSGVAGLGAAPRNVADFEKPTHGSSPDLSGVINGALADMRRNPPGSQFPEVFRERVIARTKASEYGSDKVIPERDVPGGYLVQPNGQGWIVWGYANGEMEPTQVWLIDSRGKPEGLTDSEIKRKQVEWARRYGLDGKIEIDPLTGALLGYEGATFHGHSVSGDAPTRNIANAILSRWADRLGIDKKRFVKDMTLFNRSDSDEPSKERVSIASVDYALGHDGYVVFDDQDTADLTVDLDTGKLIYLRINVFGRSFDVPHLRLTARQAQDLALPATKECNLGNPIADNLSKGGTPGYVKPYNAFAEPEDLIEPPRLRLAWRMLFEKGWVDIDAENGEVLCIGEGKPHPE
jgi:hypothetical protein